MEECFNFWEECFNFLHGVFPYIRNPSFSTQESVQVSWQSAILVTQCRAKYSHTKPSCTSNVNFVPLTSFRWRTLMRIGGSFVELFSLSNFALRLSCSSRPNWNYPMPASSTPATAPPRFECDPRKSFNSHRKVARLCIFSYFQNVDLQNSVWFNRTVLTPKSRSCDPIPYTNTIPIFFLQHGIYSARGTRACNVAEWSRIFRSLIQIFGYSLEVRISVNLISRG